ncbi:hypothetical protein CDL15_Pgr023636 [Punica granatum]|uniref:Uncharacterized protein n=2 Tax=Punica granatum TaxID=22663 RepID=A0A218W8Z4_PUNGR|nr:hypothetical protein CDL15_Pgr023636 [Punica granatum]
MLGLVCLNLFVPPSWVVHHLPPTLSCEEGSRVAELYGWYERNRLAGLSVTSNYDSIASGGSSKGADSGRLYEPSRLPDLTDTFPCMWDVSSIALFMAKWPFEASMLRDSPDVDERPQQGLRRLSEGDLRARGLPSRPSKAKHLLLVQRTTCPYRAVLHIGKNCMEWKLDGLKLLGGGALKWKGMQLLKESQHNSTKGIWPQRARTVQGGFVQNLLEMLDKVSCFDDPRLIQGFNLLSDGVANQVSDAARDSNRDGQPLQAGNDDERLVQASRLGFVCLNLFGPPSRVAPSAPFPFLNFECRFFLSVIVLSPNASLCRKKEAEYLRPPVKDKLPKEQSHMENYHRLVLMKERNPVSHQISNVVPPIKVEEDKGKVSSASTKSVAECLQEERDVESATEGSEFIGSDLFEENFKELKKWVDVNSPKYGILLVLR